MCVCVCIYTYESEKNARKSAQWKYGRASIQPAKISNNENKKSVTLSLIWCTQSLDGKVINVANQSEIYVCGKSRVKTEIYITLKPRKK